MTESMIGQSRLQTKERCLDRVRFVSMSGNNSERLLRRVRATTGREQMQQTASSEDALFDHLVGGGEKGRRHVEAKALLRSWDWWQARIWSEPAPEDRRASRLWECGQRNLLRVCRDQS